MRVYRIRSGIERLVRGTLAACMLVTVLGMDECAAPYPKVPVVLVHGLNGEFTGSFRYMIDWLEDNGYADVPLYEVDIPVSEKCIEISAAALEQLVDDILAETGAERVDIVAHSLGGLIARSYIKYLGGTESVRNYVSLTTPHHGTLIADSQSPDCAERQLAPLSAYMLLLNANDETPGDDVLYTSVRSMIDVFVIPNTSPLLESARDVPVWIDHYDVLIHEVGYQAVLEGLQGGGANSN